MKQLLKYILITVVILTGLGSVDAQTEQLTASEQWDQINLLKTLKERREYTEKFSPEQVAALAKEQINRRLKSMLYLTEEQRKVMEEIKEGHSAVFYTEIRKNGDIRKSEKPEVIRFYKTVERAKQIFTDEQLFEIYSFYGERETLDKSEQDRIVKQFRGVSN